MSEGESPAVGTIRSDQDRRNRIVAGIAVAAVVVFVVVAISSGTFNSEPGDYEARSACEHFADKRLKAPASADYNLTATGTGDAWVVTGTVDSENSFGAKIRSDVRCDLHFEGDTAQLDAISVG